jgi:6-phospho-beta-glucosidase
LKLAVVGGGSTYTPELIDGLARLADAVKLTELVLVDPDQARLDVVGQVSARIMRRYGHPALVRWTADLDDGIDGAGAVLLQLRIGGQAARHRDETWPLDYGCVGQETTGAGGLAKALRTVPVVLDIARRVRERAASGAWIIDFTNPVGIVTRALLDGGHRAIGLCNVAIGFQREFARLLGVTPGRVVVDHVGLNHLTWERAALVDGTDRLPGLLEAHGPDIAVRTGLPESVMTDVRAVPSYYLRYFWAHDEVVAAERGQPTRAEKVAALEAELLEMYADPALDTKPDLLSQRGGAFYSEAAVALLASLVNDTGDTQVVNVRNAGTLPFLDHDAVIEVNAVVGADGAAPVAVAPLAPVMRGLVAHVSAYEELAVDAALRGGRDRVAAALLAHPLVGQYDLAGQLADRLIAENAPFLSWAGGGAPAAS